MMLGAKGTTKFLFLCFKLVFQEQNGASHAKLLFCNDQQGIGEIGSPFGQCIFLLYQRYEGVGGSDLLGER